ncbi:Adenosine 3'-phospho 5'-phosphosulfate transporter 1 [Aphelenchoides besseyi]|nr:Adenosine 3'-phospho 5'-phosphosulfate transporter 1 [Aphelenchoides besseyi]
MHFAVSSRHNLHYLLICIYGVQITVVSTGFFQERLYSLGYESTESSKTDVFNDSNFVTVIVRAFVLNSIAVFYLLKNTSSVEHLCPSFLRSKSGLTSVLFCCAICLSTLSIETTQLLNDGTEWLIYGFLCVLLLISGVEQLKSQSRKHVSSVALNVCFQMMIGMNLMNFLNAIAVLNQQNSWNASVDFVLTHPTFTIDLLLLSISELIGQLFIFMTIEYFGFILFGVAMVIRQVIASALFFLFFTGTYQFTTLYGLILIIANLVPMFTSKQNDLKAIKDR